MADVGALLNGIGGIVGGLANYWSNYETNVTNKNLTRETNAQNYKIWQEQLAAAREQYEKERQENRFLVDQAYQRSLPKEQVKALKEAGINPAFALDNNSFSQLSTQVGQNPSSSVPSAPQMVAPQMVAPDLSSLGLGIVNATQYYLAAQKQEADISYLKQKQVNETLETIGKVQNYKYQNQHYKALTDQVLQDVLFGKQTWDVRARSLDILNDLNQADIDLKEAQTAYQNIINSYEPEKQQKLLKEIDNQILEIQSSIRKNDSDAAYSAALKALTNAQEKGVDMDNDTKSRTADYIVQQEAAKADFEDFKAQREGKSFVEGEAVGRSMPATDTSGHVRSYRRYSSNYKSYIDGRLARKKDFRKGGVR